MEKENKQPKRKNTVGKYVAFVLVFFLLSSALVYMHHNQIIDLSFLFSQSSSTSSKKPVTFKADITVEIYLQNPNSGEYEKSCEEYYSVESGTAYTYEPQEKDYYDINLELSVLETLEASDDVVLCVYYERETYTVTFSGGEGATLASGEEVQTLRKGQTPTAPEYFKEGYYVVNYDKDICALYEDTVFTAVWELTQYSLTLNVVASATLSSSEYVQSFYEKNCYVKNFTMLSETFILPTPELEESNFIGWNTLPNGEGEYYESIEKGRTQSLTLYSIFNLKTYEMKFVAPSGYTVQSVVAPAGYEVSAPKIEAQKQIAGYGINWYTDEEFTTLYTFRQMPTGGITLYGNWEKDTGVGIFEFDISDGKLESEEEFILYLDYVAYNYISEEDAPTMDITFASKDEIKSNMPSYVKMMEYSATSPIMYALGISIKSGVKCTVSAYVENGKENEATLTTEPTEVSPYKYAVEFVGRASDYSFYVDSLPNEAEVETTNQLLYVVEHGYKPVCKSGSSAERIYNKAKEVLNSIVGENYTDYQKALAIFDYLTLNVSYDTNATLIEDDWGEYDAFFLEGVFDNKKAVCDGISKAYSLLCNMEGIPCVQVAGNAHAWCKVKINNRWSIVDPTHGNALISGTQKSVISHEHFMITQTQKAEQGYPSVLYPQIVADYSLDYFANKTFTSLGVKHSFVASSLADISAIAKYYASNVDNISGCVLDFNYTGTNLKLDLTGINTVLLNAKFTYISVNTPYGVTVKVLFE